MKSILFLCLVFSCIVFSQTTDYIEDNCYYINGRLFGCMETVYYPCDEKWVNNYFPLNTYLFIFKRILD